MPHTVHPYAHRIGTLRGWKSRWFADNGQYQDFLRGDVLIREFLEKRLRGSHVGSIEVDRGQKTFSITIKTARPGLIIGRNGEGTAKLRKDIEKVIHRKKLSIPKTFKVEIEEIRSPESNAAIVGQMVAEGLEKRMPFKRVIKQMLEKVMANRDVKGAKIALSGRLGGADMSRYEYVKAGNIPLQTIRADVDFAREKAYMTYGVIGIKVWIYRGEIFAKDQKKEVARPATPSSRK
jgi:small subunit ribosomal protein S3